ncbi:MAG: sulfate adenylyltransferase [Peptococcaceae bacterium]|jgi:sulfate adenylyltransferase subunit 1|nr:sulfate adenylyltransferase [Peptococcaceae bacterium]
MRSLLKFITCGSVDDGKSTLIGHLLYDAKLLYADQEQALLLDSKAGSRSGAIDYSLLLDGLMAEREQGITIDAAYRYFTTHARSFIVADTPGHEEYTRNMAVGASFADLAVILLDASQGVLVQTRRHARICALMGIRYFVFAVNKMDLIGFEQAPFAAIQADIFRLKETLGLEHIYVIPLSATEGDNVTEPSPRLPWYDGEPLMRYLEGVDITAHTVEAGFYLPVQRVCRPDHTFRGFQGQIEAGSIRVGEEITALPSGEKALVKKIYLTDQETAAASSGRPVTLQLDREVDVSRGCVLTREAGLAVAKSFSASLLWMDDSVLTVGKDYFVKLGTKLLPGAVNAIHYKIDVNSGEHLPTRQLKKNEIAFCEITLSEAAVLDRFHAHKTLGELVLIDRISHMTSACGVISDIKQQEDRPAGTTFYHRNLLAQADIFEEFYYNLEIRTIIKQRPDRKSYTVGDEVPLKGESYCYPASFDVIVLKDQIAVLVRDKKIENICALSGYVYTGFPLTNGRGFGILANTAAEVALFLSEYQLAKRENEAHFFNKWISFSTYRSVIFHDDFWMI